MSYFNQPKDERGKAIANVSKLADQKASGSPQVLSTLGADMVITGNISGAGPIQILGRVTGDIHASHLVICEGAHVEGKVIAKETFVDGVFKGTIQADTVKLRGSAEVDGEIFNRSLTIEESVRFDGVSRRLDKPADGLSPANGEKPKLAVVANSTIMS
jgi:cytoskeletal protein CcmA (bactofilin family)